MTTIEIYNKQLDLITGMEKAAETTDLQLAKEHRHAELMAITVAMHGVSDESQVKGWLSASYRHRDYWVNYVQGVLDRGEV